MNITKIDFIPYHITRIECGFNKLTELPKLPDGLMQLNCDGNKLTSLPKLPESLKDLSCFNNRLTELPKLPESLIYLYCRSGNRSQKATDILIDIGYKDVINLGSVKEASEVLNKKITR